MSEENSNYEESLGTLNLGLAKADLIQSLEASVLAEFSLSDGPLEKRELKYAVNLSLNSLMAHGLGLISAARTVSSALSDPKFTEMHTQDQLDVMLGYAIATLQRGLAECSKSARMAEAIESELFAAIDSDEVDGTSITAALDKIEDDVDAAMGVVGVEPVDA